MQSDKKEETIKLDDNLTSKTIKIAGLYDPQDYGLSISMWSNSDGSILKKLFNNIDKYNLSKDASEILNISLLTNAYYPNQNITEEEFLKFKTNWLIKESNLELIEEYLIKNQITNLHPELMRYMVDKYLSESNVKKSCEIFSKIKKKFINLNESTYLKEIFTLIFPEFENLKRLERLAKICDYTQVNRELLLAVLLIDEKNNHEYFAQKTTKQLTSFLTSQRAAG